MTIKVRKTAPAYNNKYYLHTSVGGLNECIEIKDGSCLPNCVGYAWGAWYEMLGTKPKLSKGNAENWWDYDDGYKRGFEPKIGAVLCWRRGEAHKGDDGAGHVAIVIDEDDTHITVAQSAYNGERWTTRTHVKGKYDYAGLTFQGFIYLPTEEDPEDITTDQAIDKMADDVIAGKYGNAPWRIKNIYSAVQGRVNEKLKK